ncbi:hypothetical protein DFH09DRAFT_1088584 [Mycena vulgaris]|nr:hypothetical protein DFH09DRAFT_1088584 [Mycena vulgaris]
MEKLYAVLGGNNPAVVHSPPFLSQSRLSPVMPIIIKCTSEDEAKIVLDLQQVFEELNHHEAESKPDMFAKAIMAFTRLSDPFSIKGPFYAVYRGKTQKAIYVRRYLIEQSNSGDVESQVHDYDYAKFHRFETIQEALVYMVLKGDLTKMKTLGLYHPMSGPSGDLPSSMVDNTPSLDMPRVHSHIRDLSGIITTIYGTTSGMDHYRSHEIGHHASYYLQAHGYTQSTIDRITSTWADSKDVDEFVESLGAFGMASTEIRWLWDLIHHDDDCSS